MKRLGVLLFVGAGLATCAAAWADGGFFPPMPVANEAIDIRGPEQKAFIKYAAGTEDLIIQVSYEGDADQFAWVMPLPAKPVYEKVGGALFHELSKLTAPPPPAAKGRGMGANMPAAGEGVVVLERKEVGDFDTALLAATDPNALVSWLKDNDFAQPPEAEPIIKQYVAESWYFMAARIKAATAEAAERLRSGTIAPVRFTFSSEQIIYPLRLTAINKGPVEVLLYVAGDEAVTGPSLREEYSRRLDAGDLSEREYPTLKEMISGEVRLTKLRGTFEAADMQQDLVLTPKPSAPVAALEPVIAAANEASPTTRWLITLAPALALAGGVLLAGALVLWWSRKRAGEAKAEPPTDDTAP